MSDDLSPTMRACLDAIEAEQGQPARALPGGLGTVWALMRRHLVETGQRDPWLVFLPAHEHKFQTSMHLDGCHFYTTHGSCECGVVYGHRGERRPKSDGAIWMDPDGSCERCDELRKGARPVCETVIQRTRAYSPPMEVVA